MTNRTNLSIFLKIVMFYCLKPFFWLKEFTEYLTLEYADKTFIHVPVSNISLVHKFVGSTPKRPKLSKIGTKAWESQKEKVARSVDELGHPARGTGWKTRDRLVDSAYSIYRRCEGRPRTSQAGNQLGHGHHVRNGRPRRGSIRISRRAVAVLAARAGGGTCRCPN